MPAPALIVVLLLAASCARGAASNGPGHPEGQADQPSDAPPATVAAADPRLVAFFEETIDDTGERRSVIREYADASVTFETFIEAVFTRRLAFDATPDNSMAIAQLGKHIEERRPTIDASIVDRLQRFFAVEGNQTAMRGMFLETIRSLTD
jgi:hypothetical protein